MIITENSFPLFQIGSVQSEVNKSLKRMEEENFSLRLWRKDFTLWKNDPSIKKSIENSMGWLNVVEEMENNIPVIEKLILDIEQSSFTHIVLIGMGGSSLAPLVLQKSFPAATKLNFTVLDTTDPQTIINVENEIDIEKTLFIISSKSGTTIEISSLFNYFYQKVKVIKGITAGENFIAITDPGTELAAQSIKLNFRHTFRNFSDIGGRYSALSFFGLVPAALLGVNLNTFLQGAKEMMHACSSHESLSKNPGIILGVTIAELAKDGKDKLTFIIDEPISSFGLWLEQLIAESTGKENTGILPIEGEIFDEKINYGPDRVFIHFKNTLQPDNRNLKVSSLYSKGFPVIVIPFENAYDLGREFFKWEIATATMGALLGINPFDQPNVQENKDITSKILQKVEEQGKLKSPKPVFTQGLLSYYTPPDSHYEQPLLTSFLSDISQGNYICLQVYLTETIETSLKLEIIRTSLTKKWGVPVTVGYGPRFLHSTGQYHKGGPDNGYFIQLTSENIQDIPIPGKTFSFGTLKQAQAQGDFDVLGRNKRKVIRIDLGPDANLGLLELKQGIELFSKEGIFNNL